MDMYVEPPPPKASTSMECLLCSQKKDSADLIPNIFQRPDLMHVIYRSLALHIEYDPCYPNSICSECLASVRYTGALQSSGYHNLIKYRSKHYGLSTNDAAAAAATTGLFCMSDMKVMDISVASGRIKQGNNIVAIAGDAVDESAESVRSSTSIAQPTRNAERPPMTTSDDTKMHVDGAHDRLAGNNGSQRQCVTLPINDQDSLLQPMYATSERLDVTESGGDIDRRNAQLEVERQRRKWEEQRSYPCDLCPNVYRRPQDLKRHIGVHRRRRASSTDTRRQFCCKHCDVDSFPTQSLLTEHTYHNHRQRFECESCHYDKCSTADELSWHMASCVEHWRLAAQTDDRQPIVRRSRRLSQSASSAYNFCHKTHRRNTISVDTVASVLSRGSQRENKTTAARRYTRRNSDGECLTDRVRPMPVRRSTRLMSRTAINYASDDQEAERSVPARRSTRLISRESLNNAVDHTVIDRSRIAADRRALRMQYKDNKTALYMCSLHRVCAFGSKQMRVTMEHEEREHGILLHYFCDQCSEWFSTRENLRMHQDNHPPAYFVCSWCDEYMMSQSRLKEHLQLHYMERKDGQKLDCTLCPRRYLTNRDLVEHHNLVHPGVQIPEQRVAAGILKSWSHPVRPTSPPRDTTSQFAMMVQKKRPQNRPRCMQLLASRHVQNTGRKPSNTSGCRKIMWYGGSLEPTQTPRLQSTPVRPSPLLLDRTETFLISDDSSDELMDEQQPQSLDLPSVEGGPDPTQIVISEIHMPHVICPLSYTYDKYK